MKANPIDEVLSVVAKEGMGFEVMSKADYLRAKKYDKQLLWSGYCKNKEAYSIANPLISYRVIESPSEMPKILKALRKKDSHLNLGIRIKIDSNSKLGFSFEDLELLSKLLRGVSQIRVVALHFHAGWNIKNPTQYKKCLNQILKAHNFLRLNGVSIDRWNLGGSFAEHSSAPKQLQARLNTIKKILPKSVKILDFEPGRYLVGDAAYIKSTITHVNFSKKEIHINTCAYGHKFSGASPKVTYLSNAVIKQKRTSNSKWSLLGHWPADNDKLDDVALKKVPHVGDSILLNNMGAYTHEMRHQFCFENRMKWVFTN